MDFRRGASDERRRRVLMDEVATKEREEDASGEARTTRRSAARPYSEGAVTNRQPRITDLVPVNLLPLSLLSLALMATPAAIATLGYQLHARGLVQNSPALAALDLTQRGNVAEWFTSLVLAGGALLALVIFSIRRHRTDDYQGAYRMWLVVAAALIWGSLDASVHVREAFGYGVTRLSGTVLLGRPAGWWLLGYCLAGAALAIRTGLEIYRSKAATAMLGLTLLVAAVLVTQAAGLTFAQDPLLSLVIRTSLVFAASVSLVLTLTCYARYVHRDAQGLVSAAKRKKAKAADEAKKQAKAEDREDKAEANEPAERKSAASAPTAKPGPLAAKAASFKAAPPPDDDDEDEDEDDEGGSIPMGGKLSKAERKRLKRQQQQQPPQQRRAA